MMFVLLNVKVRMTAHKTMEVCFQRFLFQTMVVILLSKVRSVNEDERTTLGVLLKECQKMHLEILKSNHHSFFTDIDQITSFSNSIIDDTVSKCELVFSLDDITEKVPVLNVQHAFKVYDCLHRVFTNVQQQIRDERLRHLNKLLSLLLGIYMKTIISTNKSNVNCVVGIEYIFLAFQSCASVR